MKSRILIPGLFVVLVLMVWLFWPKPKSGQNPEAQKTKAATASTSALRALKTVDPVWTNTNRLPTPEEFQKLKPELERRRQALQEKADNEWRTPIEFYGRVVDESNNVVPYAKVDYSCNDTSAAGTSYYHMQADGNGFFSFGGIQGKLLEVGVGKEGYYSYDPHGQYFYYAGENQNFVPDAGNPVVFRLHKKGEGVALIQNNFPQFAHIAQLKHDGTTVGLDLYAGSQASSENGQLKLEYWRNLAEKDPRMFNWKLQLTMTGGGFTGTCEEFPFNAPEDGYQSSLVFDMPTNNPDWVNQVKTNYYFQLPDGKYGRMSFDFSPWNGVFTIHSLVNPSGSRYLEPAQ